MSSTSSSTGSTGTTSPSPPLTQLVRWLGAHTDFPRVRLSDAAERLLLLSVAAANESEAAANQNAGGGVQRRDQAKDAAMRAHAMRRSMVHYRCDNSAKV
ncbi:MAG TPA: hypothetical protein VFT72_13430 [Opitutaceae bacterium]|nr:hypothetical protein [Opitutaceae bacterium]